jgi:hypothetical protein
LPHIEDSDETSPVAQSAGEASASIGATDPGSISPEAAAAAGA